MISRSRTKHRDYARLHLAMSHVALIGTVLLVATIASVTPRWVGFLGICAVVIAIVTMFFTRSNDEYIAGLWQSAANAGFVAAVVLLILAPVAEGVIDGFLKRSGEQDWSSDTIGIVSVTVFLIVFNWKRYFGTA